jgi:hypothetical protein
VFYFGFAEGAVELVPVALLFGFADHPLGQFDQHFVVD